MRVMLMFCLLWVMGLCAVEAQAVSSGNYVLSISMPKIGNKDVEFRGSLNVRGSEVTFVFPDEMDGGKVKSMQGKLHSTGLALWYGDVENNDLIMYHLTGESVDEGVIEGMISISRNHTMIGKGVWKMRKSSERGISTEFILSLSASGGMKLNEEVVNREQLSKKMKAISRVARDAKITIRSAKEVKYDQIVSVIDLLRDAGVWNISFTVDDEK